MDGIGRVVVYHKGRRVERKIPKTQIKEAAEWVKTQKAQGVKAHLVYRTDMSVFAPAEEMDDNFSAGRWWCQYCRSWRYFTVPSYTDRDDLEVGSEDWFMNSFFLQGVRCCRWCRISENDWYVKKANGFLHEKPVRRHRKR